MTQPHIAKHKNNYANQKQNQGFLYGCRGRKIVWILLVICAVLTILFAIGAAWSIPRLSIKFVYKIRSNDYPDDYNDDSNTETTDKIQTMSLGPVCWDYSGIWGGLLVLLLTIAIVPRENSPASTYKAVSVCRIMLFITSALVAAVAVGWSAYSVSRARNIYLTYAGRRMLEQGYLLNLFLTLTCIVGTATSATVHCLLIFMPTLCADFPMAYSVGPSATATACNKSETGTIKSSDVPVITLNRPLPSSSNLEESEICSNETSDTEMLKKY